MNRRSFLKLVGLGGAAAATLAVLPPVLTPEPTAYSTYIMGENAVTFVNGGDMKPLTIADIRACVAALKSRSVKPVDDQFIGFVHPDRADEVNEWIRYKWGYQWTVGNSYSASALA